MLIKAVAKSMVHLTSIGEQPSMRPGQLGVRVVRAENSKQVFPPMLGLPPQKIAQDTDNIIYCLRNREYLRCKENAINDKVYTN